MSLFFSSAIKMAAIQHYIEDGEVGKNMEAALASVRDAKKQGADFICLPAAFATGISLPKIKQIAETLDGPIVQALQREAKALSVTLAAGLLERDGNDIYDTAVLVDPQGRIAGRYRRVSVWEGERDFISRGSGQTVIETPHGKVGLLVSYDLRFPEACRAYYEQGVEILVCVANLFADFGQSVEVLCRARAAENSCALVFASAQGPNRMAMMDLMGGSLIVDGTLMALSGDRDRDILARAARRQEILRADIPLRAMRKTVKQLPYKQDYLSLWRKPLTQAEPA